MKMHVLFFWLKSGHGRADGWKLLHTVLLSFPKILPLCVNLITIDLKAVILLKRTVSINVMSDQSCLLHRPDTIYCWPSKVTNSETWMCSKTNHKGRKNTTWVSLRKGERKHTLKSYSMMACEEAPWRTVQSTGPVTALRNQDETLRPAVGPLAGAVAPGVCVHSTDGLSYSQDPVQSRGSHSPTLLFSCLEERPRRCFRLEFIFLPFIRASLSSGLYDVVLFILPQSRLMLLSTYSTFQISQWHEVALWYHHGNIGVGVGSYIEKKTHTQEKGKERKWSLTRCHSEGDTDPTVPCQHPRSDLSCFLI